MTPDVQSFFKKQFGCAPTHVICVPGFVDLLGVPALCDDGLVISAVINRRVCIASTPRPDGKIELASPDAPAREVFWASQAKSNPAALWADGFKRVLEALRRRGVEATGFSAAIWDDMLSGKGFGRPTTLEVATLLALRQHCPFSLAESGLAPPPQRNAKGELPRLTLKERLHFVKLLRPSREGMIGVPPGWLGASSSLCGKAWHVLNADLRFGTVEAAPMIGEVLVVCEPEEALNAETATSAESDDDIRRHCESAAAKLGAKTMRSVELDLLKASRSKLSPREYECASHVVGEMARVVAAEQALRQDDHLQFGQFMFQSHVSSRDVLRSVSPAASALVELARVQPGCLGARSCPDVSEHATMNLVPHHQAAKFAEDMTRLYEGRYRQKLRAFVLQIVDGAG